MSIRINSLPAGTPNDNDVFAFDGAGGTKKVSKGNLLGDVKASLQQLEDIFPAEYDSTVVYNKGSLCMKDGVLKQCNSNNVTGAWNPSYWATVRLGNVATLSYTVVSEW